jgi:mono/diheme cytochrome c family protein
MKRTLALAALTTCFAVVGAPAGATAETLDGKQVFLAQKCNLCHGVSTAGIQPTTKSEKMKGPDLVNLSQRDAELLMDYLRREAEIDGKKHGKPFTGSDEELGARIAWLQKQDEP